MDIKIDTHTVIVFDLDDTLYNEIDYLKSAYKTIADFVDADHSDSLYRSMFALYRAGEDVFHYVSEHYPIIKQDLIGMYRNHSPNIKLFDGVFDTLQEILKKGGSLAIITDGRVKTQMAKLDALGIRELFSEIVISEAIGSEKPSASNYKAIEAAIPGEVYYYIGDNFRKDFMTPNMMGWKTIGLIDNGLNIHYQTSKNLDKSYFPQFLMHSYDDFNII